MPIDTADRPLRDACDATLHIDRSRAHTRARANADTVESRHTRHGTAPSLAREVFRTSRLLEFCNQKELVAQTGHDVREWPLVILKELVDNATDACEEAGIAPKIRIAVSTQPGEISISDNGPGLPTETVHAVLDYTVRVSSREAYCSPTRGAQGNALKTIVAMPFALDGRYGRIRIDADGSSHRISFSVDQLRQEPTIAHEIVQMPTDIGTTVTVFWPDSAFAQSWPTQSRDLYKLPPTSRGSTRTRASH